MYSKHRIIPFGLKNLVKKFRDISKDEPDNDEESWMNTFEQDQDAILEGERLDEEMDSYFQAQGDVLPNRLPADINLMVYNEIPSGIGDRVVHSRLFIMEILNSKRTFDLNLGNGKVMITTFLI